MAIWGKDEYKLISEKRIGIVTVRRYSGENKERFEICSHNFSGFKVFSPRSGNELDIILADEYWLRLRFWAHFIDTIRFKFAIRIACYFLNIK